MSKLDQIEQHLLEGRSITAKKGLELFGTMNLPQVYIPRMRKKGYVILQEKCFGLDRKGNDIHFWEYWLDDNATQPKKINRKVTLSGKPIDNCIHV